MEERNCSKCGCLVVKEENLNYPYYCPNCDENLFEFETKVKPKTQKADSEKENIVSSYFFYMWNAWCEKECEIVFDWEFRHFLEKWKGICKTHSVYAAAERFYAELSTNNRAKLVNRACEVYNGNEQRKSN